MKVPKVKFIRPPGPPIIWRIIDAKEKLNNDTIRVSIQDIPQDRYEEALDHMCQYFLADEAMEKCLRTKKDKDAVDSNRLIWLHHLEQGWCIGAFKLNYNGQLGELIAVNILYVWDDGIRSIIEGIGKNSKSPNTRIICKFVHEICAEFDVSAAYGVDRYFSEYGLSVKPSFRGQKIGFHLLDIWSDIGRKYGISIGLAMFTSRASQKVGERAGFKIVHSVNYAEAIDDNGKSAFPNIQEDKFVLAIKHCDTIETMMIK